MDKTLTKYNPHFEPRAQLSSLIESEYNPRRSTEKEYNDLKASIKKFGMVAPIIVNKAKARHGVIIGGHFRRKVALDMGIHTGPVVWLDVPDIHEEQELNLHLNKNTGEWDVDLLANIDDRILAEVGFDMNEIDQIFSNQPFEDDYNGEEEYKQIKKPKTKEGEIITLGRHTLMCGDSTKKEEVSKLLKGKMADIVFTDPPYNVNYEGRGEQSLGKIMNDNMSEDAFIQFCTAWTESMNVNVKRGGVFYICSGFSSFPTYLYALKVNGLKTSQPIIWVKDRFTMGWSDYRHQYEMILKGKFKRDKKSIPIIYGWKNGKHYFDGVRDEADVWTIKRRGSMVHPTQKPIEMVTRALVHSSRRGDVVLDLFGGSGTTLISAEINGRSCAIMEKDPKYCDVIRKRWEHLKSNRTEESDDHRTKRQN